MDTLPPCLVYRILQYCPFEDRLLATRLVNQAWQRRTPLDDLRSFQVSRFERLRCKSKTDQISIQSSPDYFDKNQEWLQSVLDGVLTSAGHSIKRIKIDSWLPCVNAVAPPLFCSAEGFKRWTLTKKMLDSIITYCGANLRALKLIETNFMYSELSPDSYELLAQFPRLRRLELARVDETFFEILRPTTLLNNLEFLSISGERADLFSDDTTILLKLKTLKVSHPLPDGYSRESHFALSSRYPNLRRHEEHLLVEFDRLHESAHRRRLADYRRLPLLKQFRIQLGDEHNHDQIQNAVRTELSTLSSYGLPNLNGDLNLSILQTGELFTYARHLTQLRRLRLDGARLDSRDAQALFSRLPNVEHLILTCRWSDDFESAPEITEESNKTEKFSLDQLRSFDLSLWDSTPQWLRITLKTVFKYAHRLNSFRLREFGDESDGTSSTTTFLEEIGFNQLDDRLIKFNCRLSGDQPRQQKELTLLCQQGNWPNLESLTWNGNRLTFDESIVSSITKNMANLKTLVISPLSGCLRPLPIKNNADDDACHFASNSLGNLLRGLKQLKEVRLFAESILSDQLIDTIASHENLRSVKLWQARTPNFEKLLSEVKNSVLDNGFRKSLTFFEIFKLIGEQNDCEQIGECSTLLYNRLCFFANGRSNAIDEQSFNFP